MKVSAQRLFWVLLGVSALVVVVAGAWPRIVAWRSSVERSAEPAPGELAMQGTLARNWSGEVDDRCDFRFQLWDADVNGAPTGDAVEVDDIAVRSGAFGLMLPAASLGEAGMSSWLAVGVRCGDDGEWETLAPRMQHQAIAVAGAAANFQIPDAAALVCSVPTEDDGHAPIIAGVNYRLEGGFRTAAAGGTR